MSKWAQDHDTDTADPSSWALTGSRPTARKPAWNRPRPSACG